MVEKLARVLLLALVLVLSACYRPAGEAIEPTPNTGQVLPTLDSDRVAGDATDEMSTDMETAEAMPMDDMTEEPASSGAADDGDESDDGLPPITVVVPTRVTQTVAPASFTTSSTAIPGTTPTYITPGVPLGPFSVATATPTGGAFTATPSGLVTPTDLFTGGNSACTYVVQPGDYLYRIATDNGVDLDDLRAANPDLVGDAPILQPGQELNLPCETPQPEAVQPPPEDPTAVPPAVMEGGQVYTVRSGDTLYSISREFGVTIDDIARANNMADADVLDIGQQLIIPPAGG